MIMAQSERDALLLLDDEALAAECDLEFFKGTGNGGQKRNKTSSAVRVRHRATGLAAVDCSERSQHRNRRLALRKLRRQLAYHCRAAAQAPEHSEVSMENAAYPLWIAHLLDILEATELRVSEAAAAMGVSTSRLIRLLARDPELFQEVNRRRLAAGLPPLRQG